ncbi:MAG: glycosyltransferase family 2 protein, partial [Desulfurococcales archaeon]|nr:glycosyltransferase family 2 protein [Desulfurococcales archaeon]
MEVSVLSDVEVSVVIPTYNEKENLPELVSRIHEALHSIRIPYEVIVVDDASPDGTAAEAFRLSQMYPVKVIVREDKLGLSSAVLEGVRFAEGEYVVVMDADLQHPPEVIPRLLKRALRDSCDIVVASRYVEGGSVGEWNLLRKAISKGATYVARVLLPQSRKVKDPMSGFFLFRKKVLEGAQLNPKGFKILLEILVRGRYSRVCEEPFKFGVRAHGESKLGGREIFNYLAHVIQLAPHYIRFAAVGFVGSVVNLAVLYLLKYLLGLAHAISTALAIETSVLSNFTMNDMWTFRFERRGDWRHRLIKFHGSSAAGILTQYAVSNILYYSWLVRDSLTAQLLGI